MINNGINGINAVNAKQLLPIVKVNGINASIAKSRPLYIKSLLMEYSTPPLNGVLTINREY